MVPIDQDGTRWLVAPYGTVGWVGNARQDGRVRLAVASKTRAQFSASKDAPVADSAAEADRHPVFELVAVARHGSGDLG